MSELEFIIRLIAKLLLVAGVMLLIIGSFMLESDTGFALKFIVPGVCITLPDIFIWFIDGLHLKENE